MTEARLHEALGVRPDANLKKHLKDVIAQVGEKVITPRLPLLAL